MKKNISTQELKSHVGEVIDAVRLRGDRYIVERRGKPVVAIVPLSVNESDELRRGRFFELLKTIRQQNRNMPAEQVERKIDQTLAQTRKRGRSQRA